ncbi:unnamed protein product [Effrenium voratum]|uniref:Uncharacterized protein n=1 Tax=Effrenium voratum TaxID=2562239 RepID=A0AA36N5V5_9DINO|nr:unnamed protein product [Effrenium voratum]
MGCKGPAGSDDAVHMLRLWVAASKMRPGKMVCGLAAWLRFNQTAVDGRPTWLEQFFWGQRKHGHAAHRQGACSSQSCGESPPALGHRVPLGDQQAWVQELTAKLFAEVWFLSTGHLQQQSYAMSVFATPTERGSLS